MNQTSRNVKTYTVNLEDNIFVVRFWYLYLYFYMTQFQIEGEGMVQGVTKLITTFSTFLT